MNHSKSNIEFIQFAILDIQYKQCCNKSKCVHPEKQGDGWLPATFEYFGKKSKNTNQLSNICKFCNVKKASEWGKSNPEKIKEIQKRYREKNREKINAKSRERNKSQERKEYKRKFRENNQEKEKQWKQEWYEKNKKISNDRSYQWQRSNPDKVKERNKRWIAKNPEKILARTHRRRALKMGNGGSYKPEDIQKMLSDQDSKCYYCQKDIKIKHHIDHVIPLFKGGRNDPSNLVLSCPHCNLSKGRKTLDEWFIKLKDGVIKNRIESIITNQLLNQRL